MVEKGLYPPLSLPRTLNKPPNMAAPITPNGQSNLNPLHEQKSVRDLLSYDADQT